MTSAGAPPNQELQTRRFQAAVQARAFEIEHFWKRSLFFWGFISAAFIAFASVRDTSPALALTIACFGAVCSFTWTLVNRGSKYWQEAWELKVERSEASVVDHLFSTAEPVQLKGFWGASRFSVSKLAIALSDYTVLLWLGLSVYEFLMIHPFCTNPDTVREYGTWAWPIFSIAYMVLLVIFGRYSRARASPT